ncbi:uncharacterized protein ACA1_095070 [Acanthamoeba castellanii str. Neff]|uniref:Uncharacterized protein n=1 Tax=Acanthamoeba castellanii (strain ATCC 30010 / Neff) TaxID=1257118 RepID=L8GIQ9_ACACF|nr:uncharacterized protein ACA1_095070 [Acanthamoeba castellanii str. Neff]ELR12887.1 hypothetical protein ACA1_095070 [Acanthamoeba castellanii str. Neff]
MTDTRNLWGGQHSPSIPCVPSPPRKSTGQALALRASHCSTTLHPAHPPQHVEAAHASSDTGSRRRRGRLAHGHARVQHRAGGGARRVAHGAQLRRAQVAHWGAGGSGPQPGDLQHVSQHEGQGRRPHARRACARRVAHPTGRRQGRHPLGHPHPLRHRPLLHKLRGQRRDRDHTVAVVAQGEEAVERGHRWPHHHHHHRQRYQAGARFREHAPAAADAHLRAPGGQRGHQEAARGGRRRGPLLPRGGGQRRLQRRRGAALQAPTRLGRHAERPLGFFDQQASVAAPLAHHRYGDAQGGLLARGQRRPPRSAAHQPTKAAVLASCASHPAGGLRALQVQEEACCCCSSGNGRCWRGRPPGRGARPRGHPAPLPHAGHRMR